MIDAPIGTIDMQSTIRPYIENAINNGLVDNGQFDGFNIEIMPANLDAGSVDDAIIYITYPDANGDGIRYEDYVLALGDTDGALRFSTFNLPTPGLSNASPLLAVRAWPSREPFWRPDKRETH